MGLEPVHLSFLDQVVRPAELPNYRFGRVPSLYRDRSDRSDRRGTSKETIVDLGSKDSYDVRIFPTPVSKSHGVLNAKHCAIPVELSILMAS